MLVSPLEDSKPGESQAPLLSLSLSLSLATTSHKWYLFTAKGERYCSSSMIFAPAITNPSAACALLFRADRVYALQIPD